MGEVEALRRIVAARGAGSGVAVGPGDDGAVLSLSPGQHLVATTDSFVEGRHYLSEWSDAAAIGRRLAAANLSDLAAMAATPRWALLSMGVRPDHDLDLLLALEAGVEAALARHGAAMVGGNLTAVSAPEWFTLTLLGEAPAGRAWTRAGARPGDWIAVTGHPGRSGAGLALARRLGDAAKAPEWKTLRTAWLEPEARVGFAQELAALEAVTAAIDISDGLAGDLSQLCAASGVGVRLEAAAFPEDSDLARAAGALGVPFEELRLAPSDDYELVLALDPSRREACVSAARRAQVALHVIGQVTEESGAIVMRGRDGESRPVVGRGYDAFRG